jgi:hypothetical protein
MPAYGGNPERGNDHRTGMRQAVAAVALGVMLSAGCAERDAGPARTEPSGEMPVPLAEVTADPAAHDGERITVRAGYYASFEVSALTTGFAESYPPQPAEPLVWIIAEVPEECVERAQDVTWASDVVATGTFRYEPQGGFGHLSRYEMTLENAELTCG